MSTEQFVGCLQRFDVESLVRFDVLDRADGQVVYIYPIQRILTVSAAALFVARLVMLETIAAVGLAVCLAVAMVFFFHAHLPT